MIIGNFWHKAILTKKASFEKSAYSITIEKPIIVEKMRQNCPAIIIKSKAN
jgi:hypothetical protein